MIRRRRAPRETPFSLDSFLDLVTNVVGIIIRLILVAWIGARAYTTLPQYMKHPDPEQQAKSAALPPVEDPLSAELERQRQELAAAQERLLEQLRKFDLLHKDQEETEAEEAALAAERQELDQARKDVDSKKAVGQQAKKQASLSLDELEKRRKKLLEELKALEKAPTPSKLLRYRTPVSETVHGGESHFECRHGRVTHVNLEAMIEQVQRSLRDKENALRSDWRVNDVTEPVGAFRMRYVVARRKGDVDTLFPGGGPDGYASFSYGVSEWHVEPIDPARGETAARALEDGSEFRHVIDALAVEKSAVTFWVYPDSFALYRQLRDYAADRGLTVAGRPLPEELLISGSPAGRKSRGQ